MPGYVIGNFFVYSVINAFTPGPGNILALNTVTNYGWKKGNPLFLGIFAGYYVVQLICAVFVFGVSAFLPGVLDVMKYVGAAYILWLAVHIAFSRPDGQRRKIGVLLERFHAAICQCENISVRHYGFNWVYHQLQYRIVGVDFL